MVEELITVVKVQPRKGGSFMVTIPMDIVRLFDIKRKDKFQVLVDRKKRCIIYKL